jgi:hypothetical protein
MTGSRRMRCAELVASVEIKEGIKQFSQIQKGTDHLGDQNLRITFNWM